jgi:sterol desaturase/sphingolipid hydroxylase (fatty acid hydroxylase superfamily)
MQFEKIHNKGQARLFKNDFLEMLTKTHPLVIWGMYLPVMVYMLYYSGAKLDYSTMRIILTFLGGMLFWSFFEYFAHRFLFHMVAESPRARKFVYTLHGNHHHYPRDRQRLFMPPIPSLIIASTLFGLIYLIMRQHTFMFFPGFMPGILRSNG